MQYISGQLFGDKNPIVAPLDNGVAPVYYQYKINDDGSLGVDYFANGKPVTQEEYAAITGQDIGLISQNLQNFDPNYAAQQDTYVPPTGDETMISGSASTSRGTTGDASGFTPTPYDDGSGIQIYNSPEELAAAVNRRINKDYNESLKTIEDNFKNGFLTIDERDDEIKKTRKSLLAKKDEDLKSVSGYFNAISPEAIQSGRGTMEKKAVEDFTTSNTSLGSELGSNLYDASGRIRQDLSLADLQPYMTELSDTGNLVRSIAENYKTKDTNLGTAASAFNAGKTQNASDYISNKGLSSLGNYANYLNSNVIGSYKPTTATSGFAATTTKTDRYGNPIDEYIYKGL